MENKKLILTHTKNQKTDKNRDTVDLNLWTTGKCNGSYNGDQDHCYPLKSFEYQPGQQAFSFELHDSKNYNQSFLKTILMICVKLIDIQLTTDNASNCLKKQPLLINYSINYYDYF